MLLEMKSQNCLVSRVLSDRHCRPFKAIIAFEMPRQHDLGKGTKKLPEIGRNKKSKLRQCVLERTRLRLREEPTAKFAAK